MKKTTRPKPATKTTHAPRVADPTGDALRRIVAVLRPLSPGERSQVLRSVAAYYQE